MTLSYDGWLFGTLGLCILTYCTIFGVIIIHKSRKSHAKLLKYAGFQ